MDNRQEPARRKETLFRAVNDQREGLTEALGVETSESNLEIVCECSDGDCVDQISIAPTEYARVRDDSTLYILLLGHEDTSVEVVVDEHRSYLVVRKPAATGQAGKGD